MLRFDSEALRLSFDGATAIRASGAFWACRAALALITPVTYQTTTPAICYAFCATVGLFV